MYLYLNKNIVCVCEKSAQLRGRQHTPENLDKLIVALFYFGRCLFVNHEKKVHNAYIAYLYILKQVHMVHKIGRSGNWHWRQNLVVFASKAPPTCWQRWSLSCGGLYQTILVFFAKLRSCRTTCLWKHQTKRGTLRIKHFLNIYYICTIKCCVAWNHFVPN